MKLPFIRAALRLVLDRGPAIENAGCCRLGLGDRYPRNEAAEDLIRDCMALWDDTETVGHDRTLMLKRAVTGANYGGVPWGWWS